MPTSPTAPNTGSRPPEIWRGLFRSFGPAATRHLGQAVGQRLCPGDVLLLKGGLGAGKTCFCQGLALGLGVPSTVRVTSPSFALLQQYQGRVPFWHADLYRLTDPGELVELGLVDAARAVLAIEWANLFPSEMPPTHVWVEWQMGRGHYRRIVLTTTNRDLAARLGDLPVACTPNRRKQ